MKTNINNGDLFLIKKIKDNPIIWDSQHRFYHDREQRDKVFQNLSIETKIEVDFLKRRWTTIRERYVRELRGELLANKKPTYKYMQDLNFLRNFVKIKSSSEQQAFDIQTSNHTENKFESIEFEVTEEDLKECNNEDVNDVFVELQTIFHEPQNTEKNCDILKEIVNENPKTENNDILKQSIEFRNNVYPYKTETIVELVDISTEHQMLPVCQVTDACNTTITTDKTNTIAASNLIQTSIMNRHEDTIFGELIASQLIKITDETKKREIKRSILALFF